MMARLSRRDFVAAFGAGAGLGPLERSPRNGTWQGRRPRAAMTAETRAHGTLAAYDQQGLHRTGTPADRASGEWLRREATRAGGRARLDGFTLDRLDVRDATVIVDGGRLEGLPLFDATSTGPEGVEAPLSDDGIHVATADNRALGTEGEFLREVRTRATTRAVVVLTATDVPGLVPSNARRFSEPYGCPAVQIDGQASVVLGEARRMGRSVRVTSHSVRTRATAFNVVAEVDGRDSSLAPVVVITPRSGWWTCAAERGGGLACWLQTIATAAAQRPRRPMLFLASSGHELGHLGLEAFLHEHAALVRGAHAWIHLGASIGAAADGVTPVGVRLQASSDEMAAVMAAALTATGAPMTDPLPRGRVPAGEARNLHLGDARYVSLLGQGNRWFHHRDDRYPRAVSASWVARYASAVANAALELAR